MRTRISQVDGTTIVELSGYLDFETSDPLKQSLEDIYKRDSQAKVVVDLSDLQFVGSSGIALLVKNLRQFNTLRMKPSYCGMKSEFVRLFRAFEEGSPFDIWDNQADARSAALQRYQEWEARTPRSKATH
jgi:anti-anti-sigma factor